MLYPNPDGWSANYSKKGLVTMSYGYFLNVAEDGTKANKGLQVMSAPLSVNITLFSGSDDCIFAGIDGLTIKEWQYTTYNNITLKRCKVTINWVLEQTFNNWTISQCYIDNFWNGGGYNQTTSVFKNLNIENSYISNFDLSYTNGESTGSFTNNVVNTCNFNSGAFACTNNIFLSNHDNDKSNVYKYNIADSSHKILNTGSNSNNKNYKTATINTQCFVGYKPQGDYSNDDRYMLLKNGSIASGAGENSVDCGMFGGSHPYKLSGIPAIPSFYKLDAPSTTTGTGPTYQITFSVRSNN
jgi:hypothetical protein